MALGAGAGAFQGDTARAQLALQRRGQDIGVMENERNRKLRREESAREDALRREQMAQQDRQFNAGLEQRNRERSAAEGRDARDFGESVRRFDAGEARQGRQDAWGELLKAQQIEDNALRHKAAQAQYEDFMKLRAKDDGQMAERKRQAQSLAGVMIRSALESPDGMMSPSQVAYFREKLGDDSFYGTARDPKTGYVMMLNIARDASGSLMADSNGNPLRYQDGSLAVMPGKVFDVDRQRMIMGDWLGDGAVDALDKGYGQKAGAQEDRRAMQMLENLRRRAKDAGDRLGRAEASVTRNGSDIARYRDAFDKAEANLNAFEDSLSGLGGGAQGQQDTKAQEKPAYTVDEDGTFRSGGFSLRKGQRHSEGGKWYVWNGERFVGQ
jgi:hypothetical protein